MRHTKTIALVTFPQWACLALSAQNVKIVRPREIDDVLVNPGIGFTTFQRFNGDALNEGQQWTEGYPIAYQPFKGTLQSSNASVTGNLTEAFQGRFEVSTSNGSATVEGTDLSFDTDKKNNKHGTRGRGPSNLTASTSNGSVNLRFYPAGESLAESSAPVDVKEKI